MDPRFLDEPTRPTTLPHIPLIRVKPGQPLSGVLTTPKLLGVQTHYMGRRTLPCVQEACPGCELKLARREEWYTGFYTVAPSKQLIVALTPSVAWQLTDGHRRRGTLLHLFCTFTRAGRAANSRLLVQASEPETLPAKLPDVPDLVAHLLHIWGFDQGQLGQDEAEYVHRVKDYYRGNGHTTDAAKTG